MNSTLNSQRGQLHYDSSTNNLYIYTNMWVMIDPEYMNFFYDDQQLLRLKRKEKLIKIYGQRI